MYSMYGLVLFASTLRTWILTPLGVGILVLFLLILWVITRFESSDANQWLLLIRDGRPKKAGIGLRVFRWPGDIVVRFTSTMQRVTFEADILSKESQYLRVRGFLLWSVSKEKTEDPFLAYSKLGIPSRSLAESQIPTSHHALSKPQHHAFRKMIEAVIRKTAVRFPLASLLSQPASLLDDLSRELRTALLAWGTHLESIEVIEVSLQQKEIFEHLQAPFVEKSRQEAHEVRLEAERKRETLQAEQRRDLAIVKAQTQRAQEVEMARIEMEKEQEKSKLFEQEVENKKLRLSQQEALQTLQEGFNLATEIRKITDQETLQRRASQAEEVAQTAKDALKESEVRARLRRQTLVIDADLARLQAHLAIESQKSEEIRRSEMTQSLVRSLTEAFRSLPLKEIRWLSSSSSGPQGLFLDLIEEIRRFVETKASPSTSEPPSPPPSSLPPSSPLGTSTDPTLPYELSRPTHPLASDFPPVSEGIPTFDGEDDLLEWP